VSSQQWHGVHLFNDVEDASFEQSATHASEEALSAVELHVA
jgi:hypothetical protein